MGYARHDLGRRAEEAAVSYLETCGFVIVGRNVRVSRLEIDIVAREGPVIAIVEVRTRSEGAWLKAMDTIDWRKRKRVRAAGESLWKTRFKKDPTLERMRFDIVSVTLDEATAPVIEHIKAAF